MSLFGLAGEGDMGTLADFLGGRSITSEGRKKR